MFSLFRRIWGKEKQKDTTETSKSSQDARSPASPSVSTIPTNRGNDNVSMILTSDYGYAVYLNEHMLPVEHIKQITFDTDTDTSYIEFDESHEDIELQLNNAGHAALCKAVEDAVKAHHLNKCQKENSQVSNESPPQRLLRVQTES